MRWTGASLGSFPILSIISFSGLLGEATMSITFGHSVLSRMTYSGVHLFKVPNSQSVT